MKSAFRNPHSEIGNPKLETQNPKLNVLLIEDDPGDADLFREILSRAKGHPFAMECAERLQAGLEHLAKRGADVVLLDLSLPDGRGLDTFTRVHAQAREVPIVVLTGLDDEGLAVRAVREGAQDYLVKGEVSGETLSRVMRYAIERRRLMAELEQSTRELQASKASFHNIVERNVDGIIVVDRNGVVRFVNPAMETLFGRKAEELLGELFGFPVMVGEMTEVDIVRGGGGPGVAEMRVGETDWEGERAHLVTIRDITERKRLEKVKDQFFSSVSHDLRTPLHAMKGYLDLLIDGAYGKLPAEQAEAIESLAQANKSMTELVNDLLDLSRMRNGRYILSIGPLDFEEVVDEVLEELKPLAGVKKLKLSKEFGLESLPMHSDRKNLRQILMNLVGNAIKFTKQGEIKVSVDSMEVDPSGPEAMVKIRVEDTGCGMELRHLERIFEEFYQVDQAGSNTAPGTGLGLVICKRLVGLLGGEISVESEVGKGAAFTVVLPKKIAD